MQFSLLAFLLLHLSHSRHLGGTGNDKKPWQKRLFARKGLQGSQNLATIPRFLYDEKFEEFKADSDTTSLFSNIPVTMDNDANYRIGL